MATAKKTTGTKSPDAAAKPSSGRGGIAQPVQLSDELAELVGAQSLTRAELTKRVWDYIKKHDLQDSKDRRSINADAKLLPIFGGKSQVTMFEMTKLVNKHIK
jgi:upstream activation factor subunit UAF30